jgi:SAM-dependent methyltransferase
VQTVDSSSAEEHFSESYAYFSSVSTTWLEHCENFSKLAITRFNLTSDDLVIEVACNDGGLLRFFRDNGVGTLGVEPTKSTADAARKLGLEIEDVFFGELEAQRLAAQYGKAALLVGNNVLAHVPDIGDFVRGVQEVLTDEGVVSFEFPHLMNMIEHCQFDTIYHEHYSYLSLLFVDRLFSDQGLRIFDVEEISTHGGSLRVFGCKKNAQHELRPGVHKILEREINLGLNTSRGFRTLKNNARHIKFKLVEKLLDLKRENKTIVAYGAAAKGNTLLNYCGIKHDLIDYVCDAAQSKQGKFLPGSGIPVYPPERMLDNPKPDVVLILPWNIEGEIKKIVTTSIGEGVQFITAIPEVQCS